LEELAALHVEFCAALKERLNEWDNDSTIGDIFINHVRLCTRPKKKDSNPLTPPLLSSDRIPMAV